MHKLTHEEMMQRIVELFEDTRSAEQVNAMLRTMREWNGDWIWDDDAECYFARQ